MNSLDQRMILLHDSRICDCSCGWNRVAPMPGDCATARLAVSGTASSSERTCSACRHLAHASRAPVKTVLFDHSVVAQLNAANSMETTCAQVIERPLPDAPP